MRRFILYCLFGGTGVLVDLLIYTLLLWTGLPYVVANIMGYASGTAVSFVLNRRLNFGVLDKVLRRLLIFGGVALIGLAVSTVLLWLFVDVAGIDELWGKILTLPVVVVLQFSLNRLITFRPTDTPATPAGRETAHD